jgi:steroid 5-alpha reductase family enzyme
MTGFDGGAFAVNLGLSAAGVTAVFAAAFVVGVAQRRHCVVDVAWGSAFAAVAVISYAASAGHGDATRRGLLTVLVVVWGLRLALHIARKNAGRGEDPRYAAMLAKAPRGRTAYAARKVYLLQAAIVLAVSLPVQVGQYADGRLGPLAAVGVALWAVGLFFEAVGDWQLLRFKSAPANRGAIMDRGLWRFTRHPNYFGDFCVWWGVYLIAAEAWPGALTVPAPLLMTFFLTLGTGAALTESRMSGRPGFADYVARTSGFLPRPPRARAFVDDQPVATRPPGTDP